MKEVLLGFRILFLAQTSEAKKAEPRKFNVNNMEEEEKILRSFCQTTHTHRPCVVNIAESSNPPGLFSFLNKTTTNKNVCTTILFSQTAKHSHTKNNQVKYKQRG
jgi:hypothetical protein